MNPPLCRPMLSLATFSNAMRVLHCIDLDECREVGLFKDEAKWPAFRDNPVGFFIRADDETQAKLWQIVAKRVSPPPGRMGLENVANIVVTDIAPTGEVAIVLMADPEIAIAQIIMQPHLFIEVFKKTTDTITASFERKVQEAQGVKPQ